MLSILIPTYNYNIYPLILDLQKQCKENNIAFEIIGIDDGSHSEINSENDKINELENCSFTVLATNVGLSQNRNILASKAKYPNLLFIDGDSIVINPNFIQNYIVNIDNNDIVYGGRVHPEAAPSPKQKLRWKYGRYIEDKTASQRNCDIYKTVMFNNTLIKKDCFNQIKFDSTLKKYGHEDTLFAYEISLSGFKVNHIDNAIEHGDIDESPIYISKVKNSLNNLILLYEDDKIDPDFVKILQLYRSLKSYRLIFLASTFFTFFDRLLYKQLISKNPSLFLFNLYRIGYLCSLKK